MKKRFTIALLILFASKLFAGCSSDSTSNNEISALWAWIAGDNAISQPGIYGTKGTPNTANKPGSRYAAISWRDPLGKMWLFGGFGYAGNNTSGPLNDLWRWDGAEWTWVSGDNITDQLSVYGTQGVAASDNKPGARYESLSWTDPSGNLWLFGGHGYDINHNWWLLNDLWRWDGTNWTWVSGDQVGGQSGVYGTIGTPAATNKPGGRVGAVAWVDAESNLWLFGGLGYDSNGSFGRLNDLWRWDGTNWTWVSGDNTVSHAGVYGTKGTPDATNKPGTTQFAVSWADSLGNFWLFGGSELDGNGVSGYLNDLWRWDGANWTWIAGDNTFSIIGVYGIKGAPSALNKPSGRYHAVSWTDAAGNFWLFGENGADSSGIVGSSLNDLWRWDGKNWTWMAGDKIAAQPGIYGSKGHAAFSNTPGARYDSVSWVDGAGGLWLFGGYGYDSNGNLGYMNDLWRFE